jgi:hypothetical protein
VLSEKQNFVAAARRGCAAARFAATTAVLSAECKVLRIKQIVVMK